MEELTNTALSEETTPQGTDEQSTTEENTGTVDQSTTSDPHESEGTDQNSEHTEQSTEQDISGVNEADSAPFLTVRYNHESRELTQAEAVSLAQKAMQTEPLMSDLRYLAAQDGATSVAAFVKTLKESVENNRRSAIMNQLVDSGNTELLETLLNAETEKIRAAAGAIEQDENKALSAEYEDENARIADEFLALKAEFPEMNEFKDVPQQVIQLSAKKNISLLDAYLRFQHEESKKIKEAEQSAAKAEESTVGSAVSEDHDSSSPLIEAMRNGVWR